MLEASIAPSAPPAPTIVCTSSIKTIISSFSSSSFNILETLSSNSPRYFVPATKLAIGRERIVFPLRGLGTLPSTILLASSSTIAVFPTPASPISKGLFLPLRHNISIKLLISSSLPITGSTSLPTTFLLRLTAKSSTSNFLCIALLLTLESFDIELYISSTSILRPIKSLIATPSPSSSIASNNSLTLTSTSPFSLLFSIAVSITLFNKGVYKNH